MAEIHQITQLLVASWVLGGGDRKMPTSHGLLDLALKRTCDKGAFPEWMRKQLHFANARTGLLCVELPTILDWAQTAELTEAPNPSYRFAQVQIDEETARELVKGLGVAEQDAANWGKILVECLKAAEEKFAPYHHDTAASYTTASG